MQLKEPRWTCRTARRSSASAMPTASRWRRRTGKLANQSLSKLQASLVLHFQEHPCPAHATSECCRWSCADRSERISTGNNHIFVHAQAAQGRVGGGVVAGALGAGGGAVRGAAAAAGGRQPGILAAWQHEQNGHARGGAPTGAPRQGGVRNIVASERMMDLVSSRLLQLLTVWTRVLCMWRHACSSCWTTRCVPPRGRSAVQSILNPLATQSRAGAGSCHGMPTGALEAKNFCGVVESVSRSSRNRLEDMPSSP